MKKNSRWMSALVGLAIAATALTIGLFSPAVASATTAVPAATSHAVSGTVFSNGAWFKSSTVRSVRATTNIVLSLTHIPSRGIKFRLANAKTNRVFTGTTPFSATGTKTLATHVLKGTLFQNEFAQGSGHCIFRCGFNFAGNEVY